MIRHRVYACLFLAVLLLAACGSQWTEGEAEGGPATLMGIGVAPDFSVLPVGEIIQFRATGYYDDLSSRDLTDIVDWQSWNSSVLEVTEALDWEGKAMGISAGESRVRAVYRDIISNEVRVTVTDAQLTHLTVSPSQVALAVGDQVQLVAEAAFSDGSYGTVTGSVQWVTQDPFTATVTPGGELRAESTGQTLVAAIWGDGSDLNSVAEAEITVLPAGQVLPPPDLRIGSVQASSFGDQVTWTVQVENAGGQTASEFWVDAWLDLTGPPLPPPVMGDIYVVVDALGPGESTSVTLVLEGVEAGYYNSWFMIDSMDRIDEGLTGEGDNVVGPVAVEVTPSPGNSGDDDDSDPPGGLDPEGTPDLAVIWLDAFTVSSPDGVFYFVDVQNQGDAAVSSYLMAVYGDLPSPPDSSTSPDRLIEAGELAPGATAYLSAEVTGSVGQSWHSWILVDPGEQYAELDETNNLAEIIVEP
ncbi:MAG: Ig-like domain-containing protein [Myxococcota bacterium]|nr:Ig-like domain-containing protein [Myxococcota bacterium]